MSKDASRSSRISIKCGDHSFLIEGPEDVVERTLENYLPALMRLVEIRDGGESAPLGLVRTADVDAANGTNSRGGPPDLATWYQERLIHPEGKRGFVQDHVLLFVYYTTEIRGNPSASTAEIRRSFELLELKPPNVPVMVYNLKTKGTLEAAEEYASYRLTGAGKSYIEERFGIVRRG